MSPIYAKLQEDLKKCSTVSVTIPYISISRIFILIFLFLLCLCSVPVYLVMAAMPESRHVIAIAPESRHDIAIAPESRHVMDATPESSRHGRHTRVYACHYQHTSSFPSGHGAWFTMELLDHWISPGTKETYSNVMDPQLRSVRAAGIPGPVVSAHSSPVVSTYPSQVVAELLPLSSALSVMASAILCVWITHTPTGSIPRRQ